MSLDSATGGEIEDAFIGFLPRNVNPPEGEGSVSFTVALRDPPIHGLMVRNNASIYFDANKPVITNYYANTFDLKPPTSQVTSLNLVGNVTPDALHKGFVCIVDCLLICA